MAAIAVPLIPPALAALGKAALFVGSAAAAAFGVNYAMNEMSQAEEEVKPEESTKTTAITCATCAQNPCAELACGAPGSKYRGGAHGCVGLADNKLGPSGTIHSHHVPADHYSPLPRAVGPAIQMEAQDHYASSSYGSKVHGPPYAAQRAMLARGQTMQALMMDAAEVRVIAARSGNPTKYDEAIAQMFAYANCLRQNGIIK
ncbi:hypothetical protein [Sinorhizobium saheli]|uniref:Uncharacterized protein n=1 Tax=Sinorhizobium saheli TaxID=36856 RepID=A0A178Y3M2_SINSA|nr:hypothetical protein [Sinorhizobium saheli]MQW87762.1 hypothetical protein [Sinorhizobium saheli]OAP41944.1 hypothetical protein ATB98_05865 [Sinorhizobium saheli]